MSTYDSSGKVQQRKRHDEYLPIAVAIMLACCFTIIFGINPEAGGYGGGSNVVGFYESAGLMSAGVLVGYLAFVFRAT
ncbi:MAG: hypothetical protein KGH89_05135 [Thaumarchaeota archaeon]|nr:hypothetical protein [Nitrososphaerota archaeon]MDE1867187.1 hypothetical protein [Nitrososphaerota archaeon]